MSYCKVCKSQLIGDECINKKCKGKIKFIENSINHCNYGKLNIEDVTDQYGPKKKNK